MVSNNLLATKFFIPSIESNLVKRDRLLKSLDWGTKGKLTLISALNKSTWIESLKGNQRYIWDYLTEEVLQQQPDRLK